MRIFLFVTAVLAAGPALADRQGAFDILVSNLMGIGADQSRAVTIARCFVDRMTEAEAAAYVSARTEEARSAALLGMQANADAQACVQAAVGG